MNNSLLSIIISSTLAWSVATAAHARNLNGSIFVKSPQGAVLAVPAKLDMSSEALTIVMGNETLTSVAAQSFDAPNGQVLVGSIFLNPPKSTANTALILRGLLTADHGVNGDFFVATFAETPSQESLNALLTHVLSQDVPAGVVYESAFSFSAGAAEGKNIEKISVAISGGRLFYARYIYDQNDSSKVIGCWTNAGVGRNAEYYAGECPTRGSYAWEARANGQVMTAAGFERGVPYSWTRQGQLQALMIGAERTRAFNETYLAYSRPNFMGWGFFFMFPL